MYAQSSVKQQQEVNYADDLLLLQNMKVLPSTSARAGLAGVARAANPATMAARTCLLSGPSDNCAWAQVTTFLLARAEVNARLLAALVLHAVNRTDWTAATMIRPDTVDHNKVAAANPSL